MNLEGLIPLLGGLYAYLLARGVVRASKDNDLFYRSNTAQHHAKVYLILGCLSIAGSLIALVSGFRLRMVGY